MNAKQPAPAQQVASRPPGIFTGEPMPVEPLPPSIWGLPEHSDSSGKWFTRLAGATQEPQTPMLGPPGGPAVPVADQSLPPPGGLLGLFLGGRRQLQKTSTSPRIATTAPSS